MRYTIIIAAFLLFSNIPLAHAEPMEAGKLYQFCNSKDEKLINRCGGYIQGLIDYHQLTKSLGTAPTVEFCIPKGTSLTELILVINHYLEKNSQHDSFIAAPAVSLALFGQYPCP